MEGISGCLEFLGQVLQIVKEIMKETYTTTKALEKYKELKLLMLRGEYSEF